MKLFIISGRSGSGKSTALRVMEDAGFNSIDNFPVNLLKALLQQALSDPMQRNTNLAVCIDARNHHLEQFPEILLSLDGLGADCEVIYLDARSPTLVKRFSETRRRHPLTNADTDLRQAIDAEARLLASIADMADLNIDTTTMDAADLMELISSRVLNKLQPGISLLFRSFGFKHGVPVDADTVFDLRCLPNPHWVSGLRELTGLDAPVREYLQQQPMVADMVQDVRGYLETWIPRYEQNHRAYMTVALGCTGGQHRSVYMAQTLADHFGQRLANVLVRHRELDE